MTSSNSWLRVRLGRLSSVTEGDDGLFASGSCGADGGGVAVSGAGGPGARRGRVGARRRPSFAGGRRCRARPSRCGCGAGGARGAGGRVGGTACGGEEVSRGAPDTYAATLAADSVASLAVQGGPMEQREQDAFERLPFAQDALLLRQADESGKVDGLVVVGLSDWMPIVRHVSQSARRSATDDLEIPPERTVGVSCRGDLRRSPASGDELRRPAARSPIARSLSDSSGLSSRPQGRRT